MQQLFSPVQERNLGLGPTATAVAAQQTCTQTYIAHTHTFVGGVTLPICHDRKEHVVLFQALLFGLTCLSTQVTSG